MMGLCYFEFDDETAVLVFLQCVIFESFLWTWDCHDFILIPEAIQSLVNLFRGRTGGRLLSCHLIYVMWSLHGLISLCGHFLQMSSLFGLAKTFTDFLIQSPFMSLFLPEGNFLHLGCINLSMIVKYLGLFVGIVWKLVSSNGRVTCLLVVRKKSIEVFFSMAGVELRKQTFFM